MVNENYGAGNVYNKFAIFNIFYFGSLLKLVSSITFSELSEKITVNVHDGNSYT